MTAPQRKDFRLTRGDTWRLLRSDVDTVTMPAGLNLLSAGAVVRSTIKRYRNDPDPGLSQVIGSVVDETHADVVHDFSSTELFPVGSLWYDVTVDVPPDRSFTRVFGNIECIADLTITQTLTPIAGSLTSSLPLPSLLAAGVSGLTGQLLSTLPLPALSATGEVGEVPSLESLEPDILLHWSTRLGGQSLTGRLVTALADQSPNGRDALLVATEPAWNYSGGPGAEDAAYISLPRRTDGLIHTAISLAAGGRYSFFLIGRPHVGVTVAFLGAAGAATGLFQARTGGTYDFGATDNAGNTNGISAITSPIPPTKRWHQFDTTYHATGWRSRIDAVDVSPNHTFTATAGALESVEIGLAASSVSYGDFAELVVFGRALTLAEIADIVDPYFAHWYGATVHSACGAWSWFENPRAIHHVNGGVDRTYIGVVDHIGEIAIIQRDHVAGTTQRAALVTGFEIDDHNTPTVLIRDSDKRLLAFWNAHVGPTMWMAISTNPEDATAWGAPVSLDAQIQDDHYTYSIPIQLLDETNDPIYLYYRGNIVLGVSTGLYYSKSTDGGATWSARTLVLSATTGRPYYQIRKTSNSRVEFFATNDHPAENPTVSVYHFYYEGGLYYQTDGTLIGAGPVTVEDATLVFDASGSAPSTWCWDVRVDGSQPCVLFATFPSTTDHRYRFGRWNGSAWVTTEICTAGTHLPYGVHSAPHYSGGLSFGNSVDEVYCSREVGGTWEVYLYTTADDGATWSMSSQITTDSGPVINMRPVAPWNGGHAEMPMLWMRGRYDDYADFNTKIRTIDPALLRDGIVYP